MRCDQAYELIGAYLDEELSGSDRTSVADHIESCAGCRVLISDIKRTSTAVAELAADGRDVIAARPIASSR